LDAPAGIRLGHLDVDQARTLGAGGRAIAREALVYGLDNARRGGEIELAQLQAHGILRGDRRGGALDDRSVGGAANGGMIHGLARSAASGGEAAGYDRTLRYGIHLSIGAAQ